MLIYAGTPFSHLGVLLGSMNLHIVCTVLAGRTHSHLQNWEILTQDLWVLQAVQGYLIDFTQTPIQLHHPPPTVLPTTDHNMMSEAVIELLNKEATVTSSLSLQGFVSLVHKKGGGKRPVINLRALNQFVRQEHFKMEGLHLLQGLLLQGDWMIKLDLKDAYFKVSIHLYHQKYLQFT